MSRPAIPDPPYRGACLCGGARYVIEQTPLALNACYCADCQKLTGATHVLMVMAPSAAFKLERGKVEVWRKRADSGREVDVFRCADCGCRLWHQPLSAPEFVFVAAGTLDDTSWIVPTSHIWTDSAAPSAYIPRDDHCCAGQPKDRRELIDAFAAAYEL